MRALLLSKVPLSFLVATVTSGCNIYYESKAEDMVERQMEAMVLVEGGEFMMGNPGGWDSSRDSWPPHKVALDDFHIQKYEVTQGDFELFMSVTGYEPSNNFYEKRRQDNPERYKKNLPAVASWTDAERFCDWLGDKSSKPVRLPTEAQWEFAARARGQLLRYATENGEAEKDVTIAAPPSSSRLNSLSDNEILPKPPGSFPPNSVGLYDMSGNAAEWVYDFYSDDYYSNSPVENPLGPDQGIDSSKPDNPYRVLRGGNYKDFLGNTTVTRRKEIQNGVGATTGFRCAY